MFCLLVVNPGPSGNAFEHYTCPFSKSRRACHALLFPLIILYTLFAFGMQFIQTGADRLGECPGLEQAAASSNVIAESKWRPGRPALGCEVERRDVFLTYYKQCRCAWCNGYVGTATYYRQTSRVL
jgi:hypothetical protein